MHEEMLNSQAVSCPSCGTEFDLLIDTSQGAQAFWEDCPRCCAPIQVSIVMSAQSGELESVTLGRDDDVL